MKKGFTLIELMVVVLIIGILASIALPQYMKSIDRARASEIILNSKNIADAMNRYYQENDRSYTGVTWQVLDLNYGTTTGYLGNDYFYEMKLDNTNKRLASVVVFDMKELQPAEMLVTELQNGMISSQYCGAEEDICKAYFNIGSCGGTPSKCTLK